MLVAAGMRALVFLLDVELPEGVEVTVGDHGTQEEEGFSCGTGPAGSPSWPGGRSSTTPFGRRPNGSWLHGQIGNDQLTIVVGDDLDRHPRLP